MCVEHNNTSIVFTTKIAYLIAIALGILAGSFDIQILKALGLLSSDIFIRIFKCISLPIIALSIIVTISSYSFEGSMRKLWKLAILYTLSTTIIAAFISFLLYIIIAPNNINVVDNMLEQVSSKTSYLQHVINLIPNNIFSPFLEHQVIGVLIVGIIIGTAIRFISDVQARETITNFFKGAHGLFLVITNWVVKIIPIGLFGFITTSIIQLKEGMDLKSLGEYISIIVLANMIQGFIILPLWLKFNRINPIVTFKAMIPALSIAFFSKSSAGTLPVTIDMAEKNLNIDPKISRFVLPLCTSINMNGCAAFIFTTVIYIMQNYGIDISISTMLLWILIASIAAIGNAGVPMGCFFLSASLLASMNIPITLLGLILPFYSIIDMIETSLNVWSDSCVAKVIDKKVKAF